MKSKIILYLILLFLVDINLIIGQVKSITDKDKNEKHAPVVANQILMSATTLHVDSLHHFILNENSHNAQSSNQQTLALPDLCFAKVNTWPDYIVFKKSAITDIANQLNSEDSPLYNTDTIYFGFLVENAGNADCPIYSLDIYIDNVKNITSTSSSTLPVYSTSNIVGIWAFYFNPNAFTAGVHNIKIVLDPQNSIAENDETNNQYSRNFTILSNSITQYSVSLSSNPTNGGTYTGGGLYNSGSSVTVTATPNNGYTFTNWTENGTIVSTSANYTFTITNNRSLVANFSIVNNTTITTNPTGRSFTADGTIYTAAQSFPWTSGSTHTVSVTSPQSGSTGTQYVYSGWSDEGAQSHTITTPGLSTTYTANFTTQYYLTLTAGTGGTVSSSSWYNANQSVTVTAIPNSGYTFANWSENGTVVSTSANYSFTITNSRSLVANFSAMNITTVTTNPAGRSFTVDGTTYTSVQTFSWAASTTHTLSVTSPQSGSTGTQYVYSSWSDGGTQSHTITIPSSATTYTANFTTQYYLTLTAGTGGTVSSSSWYNASQSATATATPNNGYTFANWTENGSVVSTSANYTFTMTNSRSLVANFIQQFNITILSNPTGGGTTTGASTYNSGISVTVTATANSGYIFIDWTEGGSVVSSNPNYTFNISSSRALVANFIVSQVSVSQSYSFANPTSTTSYKLFGLPGDNNFLLSEIMTGSLDNDWVAYRDNGQASNYYEKFTNSSNFYVKPGLGFWIISKNTINVNRTVQSVAVNSSGQYVIPLQSSWNIISNPFNIAVNWSSIASKNNVGSDIIWDFANGTFVVSQTLDPYKGYYFKNTNTLSTLNIPYPTLAKRSNENVEFLNNELKISLNKDNKNISEVKFGFSNESNEESKKYNISRPVSDFEVERMVIYNSELDSNDKFLYRVIRNNEFDEERYQLQLKVIPNKQYSISITDTSNDKFIYLVDNKLNVVYNLKRQNKINFSSTTAEINYELIVSKNAIQTDGFSNSLPNVNKLYQNYPNPFNPSTTIRFNLETPSYVSLKIYNAIGAEVRELINGYVDKGYYEMTFDGKELSSGIYFCRLIAEKKMEIIKMLLIK